MLLYSPSLTSSSHLSFQPPADFIILLLATAPPVALSNRFLTVKIADVAKQAAFRVFITVPSFLFILFQLSIASCKFLIKSFVFSGLN